MQDRPESPAPRRRRWPAAIGSEARPPILLAALLVLLAGLDAGAAWTSIASDAVSSPWGSEALLLAGTAFGILGLTALFGLLLERAAARLRESETLFRAMFDASADGLFISRPDPGGIFRMEACNGVAAANLRSTPEALAGRRIDQMLPPIHAAKMEENLRRCLELGDPVRFEGSLDREDDLRVWEIVLVPLRGPAARFDRVFGTARDISHLKRAEAAALASNRMLVMAEEIAHVGHWRLAVKENRLAWSREIYRIYGLDPETTRPTVATAVAAYHPEDRSAIEACLAEAVAERRPYTRALRLVRPDGTVRHVVARCLCEEDEAGEVVALFGTLSDVTELRRVEREAAETASLLATTLESMDQGLIVVSPERRVEICNSRAVALLDLPPDLMLRRPLLQEVLDHQWAKGEFAQAEEPVRRFVRNGGLLPTAHTYTRTRPNGTVLEMRTMPMSGGGFVRTFTDVTAHRRVEEALRESETRYRLIAENVSDVITVRQAGTGGAYLYVSPAMPGVLGYGPAEFAALPGWEIVHPDERDRVRALYAGIGASRPTATSLHRMRHRDGRWIWVEIAFAWMPGENGREPRVLGAIRDVGRRVAAEAALRKSETLYRLLAETTTDIITRLTLDFAWEYVSPACRAVLGYEPHELLHQRPSAVIHPEDLAPLRDLMRRLAAGTAGDRVTTTYRARHKGGTFVWIEAGMSLMRDDAGRPVSIVCSLRDITGRKAAEAALEASEARYRLLSENGSDMIVQADLDTTRRYVSPACRELLGYEPEELVGTKPLADIHPDDRAAYAEGLSRLAAGLADRATYSCRYRRRDGSHVWVEAKLRLLRDAGGAPRGYVAVLRDVSERQHQAAALEQARDAAERANRAKTDFLATMSHEIRTPLNGILGYTDLLLEDPALGERHRRQGERIQSAGAALLTILNDILDFSKIEAGQVELDSQPFLLESLVDNTISVVRGFARKKSIAVRMQVDPAVPRTLVGDQDRLRQILLNLLNNAVKFTHAGSVTLSVACTDVTGPDATLRFSVTDTGIGIPEDKRGRLFQRFSQLDGSIRRDYGGTGLGLAISKNLVELMGGAIGVESVVSEGTTFWFTVTLPVGAIPAIPAAPDPVVAGMPSARILLVEDLEINQEIARAVLEGSGHAVDVASDGLAAIVAVQDKDYDLVLMDVQMPGMDGITATRHIRALPHPARALPIIAMTANVLPAQIAEFRAAGMDDHVGKPFKRDDLRRAIARWCPPSHRDDASAAAEPVLDRGVFEEACRTLGGEHVAALLARLGSPIDQRLAEADLLDDDRRDLAQGIQAVTVAAGLLGFAELSRACADLEAACRHGLGLDPALARVRLARRRALSEIEGVRAVA
ncbi:PAS domain-containing hybrid sensor histidine kinase/response regulator [Methylobacterium sp. ID0610]|uniref:PAS domain-containing hybrid sensor histidine kinase/response regulator n=1 Tax=Methylobacterium carpenticola TaxID=3344827 RepID=UPI0036B49F4A